MNTVIEMPEKPEMEATSTSNLAVEPNLPQPKHVAPGGKITRQVITGLAALALVAGAVFAGMLPRIRQQNRVVADTATMSVPVVSIVHPKRSAPVSEIMLPGDVQPFNDSPIFARTNGYLKQWYVDIGAHVHAGQLLAEIETPEVDQELQQARADLDSAQANYHLSQVTAARYEDLLKSDSVSKQSVDNAEADFQAKAAMVQAAQDNVNRLQQLQSFEKIYAPFDGVITARRVDIGDLIDAGSSGGNARELFHIAKTSIMRVYVSVPQIDAPGATPGLTAYLTVPEYPDKRFTGKLVRNSDAISFSSRTLNAEIDVDNPTGELRTGSYAEVHLKIPNGTPAFIIPANTLIFRSAGLQVGIVDAKNEAQLIPITIGRDYGNEVEVTTGLTGGESVIVNPPDSLVSGETVREE